MSLHTAVVSAQLTSSRVALLGGIAPALVESLPICANHSSQILSDLHVLNAADQLGDGVAPLRLWLENALALAGPRSEADVFRSVLATAEALDAITRPVRLPRPAGEQVADELSRIDQSLKGEKVSATPVRPLKRVALLDRRLAAELIVSYPPQVGSRSVDARSRCAILYGLSLFEHVLIENHFGSILA